MRSTRRQILVSLSLIVLGTLSVAASTHRVRTAASRASARAPSCVCFRGASVGDVAKDATLLAIGIAEAMSVRPLPGEEHATVYRVRLIRAWRWPGGKAIPPKYADVYSLALTSCSGYVSREEPFVVQATYSVVPYTRGDTVLSLAGRCSLEGPVDTAGAFGALLRREYGEEAFRRWARQRAAEMDSLRLLLGPGVEPAP